MDIFGIIYKALNKLNKLVTGLRKDVDNKQAKLTYADGNEVIDYKDLKLNMLKGLPFRDTVLIVNDTKEDGHYVTITTETSSRKEIIVHDQDYTIYIKDPVKYFYSDWVGGDLNEYISACLSLKTPGSSAARLSNCEKLTYCGYIDTMDSSTVNLERCFYNCGKLSYIPDYFVQVPITSMASTFCDCKSLTKLPMLNTSSCDNFSSCCAGCGMYEIPSWDFSKGVNFQYFCFKANNLISVDLSLPEATNIGYGFSDCKKLTTCYIDAPKVKSIDCAFLRSGIKTVTINTGKQCDMGSAFAWCYDLETVLLSGSFSTLEYTFCECSSLKELPALTVSDDPENPTSINAAFDGTGLTKFPVLDGYVNFGSYVVRNDFVQEIPRYNTSKSSSNSQLIFETPQLTTVGGFKDMATKIISFYRCPLLTRDSILNIFNDLASINTGGTYKIIFHEEAYNRLSEEDIAIAVNKNWVVNKYAN